MKAIITTSEGRTFEKEVQEQGDAVRWIIFKMKQLALLTKSEELHDYLGMNEYFKQAVIEGSEPLENARKLIEITMRNINMDIFLDSEKHYAA